MLTVITVLHNSDSALPAYRQHFEQGYDPERIAFVFVDNASDQLADVSNWKINPAVIRSANNGFGAGCNVGWRSADSEWVGFVNPDVEMTSFQALALVESACDYPDIGVIAPFVSQSDSFSRAMGPPWRTSKYAIGVEIDAAKGLVSAASVSGCCLFVRKALLERLGGFDERFFMYCEENDLQKRILDAGFSVAVAQSIKVRHGRGLGSSNRTLNRSREREKSRSLFYKKHFSIVEYGIMRIVSTGRVIVGRFVRAKRA